MVYEEPEYLDTLVEKCPVLTDPAFLERHPGIVNMLRFIDETSKQMRALERPYRFFQRHGVQSTEEYLALIVEGNEGAIASYQQVCSTLGLQNTD